MIKFKKGNLRIPKLQRPVYVVAGGMTDFRKRYPEKATEELVVEAAKMAFEENDLKISPDELRGKVNFCVYSQFADHFGDQLLAEARVHDALGFDPLGNFGVKTGGATGGSSVLAGVMAVASGYASCVPVVGWERMDEVGTREGNSYIASAADKNFESELGWIYTSYYALMAQRYLYENEVARDVLAKIAVKNRGYARYSPFAQAPMDITEQDVLESKFVSDPLSFLDCCLMSTGAACLVLADEQTAFQITDDPIKITMGPARTRCAPPTGATWKFPCCPTKHPKPTRIIIGNIRVSAPSSRREWRRITRTTPPGFTTRSRISTSLKPTMRSQFPTFRPMKTSGCAPTVAVASSSSQARRILKAACRQT